MAGAGVISAVASVASDAPGAPRVVAIVLNWCNERDTAACLESLAASHYVALTVLLVDNGSTDGSGERLHARFPDTPYLQTGTNTGYAGGNNRGIAWALEHGAEYVLVLNNDTAVDPSCVRALVRAAVDTGAAAVAPLILYHDDPSRVWYGGGVFSTMRALGLHVLQDAPIDPAQTRAPISFLCGCAFLIRADVVRKVGGFDESFFAYVEDVELSVRLGRAGYRLMYEPAARVLHRIKPAAPDSPFQIRQRDQNRRRLVRRHYGFGDRLRFAAWFYPTRILHLLRYLASGDTARAKAVVLGAFGELSAMRSATRSAMLSASDFVRLTQKTNLRSVVMQFDSRLTQLQYRVPYDVTRRYLSAGVDVLDWGCGNGHFSFYLTTQNVRTWGYSFEPCREYLSDQALFTFVAGSPDEPSQLPFTQGRFDAAFSVGVLEHVYETGGDEAESLNEIHRVLKPGGLFFCFHFPNKYQWVERVGRVLGLNQHFHARKYTRDDIRRLVARADLELLELGRYNFFPRNQLARLPGVVKNGAIPVRLFELLDAGLARLFPFLCTNFYFVARKRDAA